MQHRRINIECNFMNIWNWKKKRICRYTYSSRSLHFWCFGGVCVKADDQFCMKSQADLKSQADTITHWGWGFYRLSESWWGIWLCLLWYEHQKHQNWRDLDEKIILDIQFFIKLQKSRKLEQKPGFTFFLELCPESLISSDELKDFSDLRTRARPDSCFHVHVLFDSRFPRLARVASE